MKTTAFISKDHEHNWREKLTFMREIEGLFKCSKVDG